MTEHPFLFEIVQKAFNAGKKFTIDTEAAGILGKDFPSAYPVITPLIEEAAQYCDSLIKAERESHIENLTVFARSCGVNPRRTVLTCIALVQSGSIQAGLLPVPPSRPSSPFRSVEIVDGELK